MYTVAPLSLWVIKNVAGNRQMTKSSFKVIGNAKRKRLPKLLSCAYFELIGKGALQHMVGAIKLRPYPETPW